MGTAVASVASVSPDCEASSHEYDQDQLEQERSRSKSLPPRQHQRK